MDSILQEFVDMFQELYFSDIHTASIEAVIESDLTLHSPGEHFMKRLHSFQNQ